MQELRPAGECGLLPLTAPVVPQGAECDSKKHRCATIGRGVQDREGCCVGGVRILQGSAADAQAKAICTYLPAPVW
jgi:hypothetical protein